MPTRSEIKSRAKQMIQGNIGYLFVCIIIIIAVSSACRWIAMAIFPAQQVVTSSSAGVSALTQIDSPSPTILLQASDYLTVGIMYFIDFFITAQLKVGLINANMYLYKNKNDKKYSYLFSGFTRKYYWKIFVATLLVDIFVFLWSLLLVVPGIIKGYAYSQTYYILLDNPDMKVIDAIKESERMMKGHKFELFVLQISFILWSLLVPVTCGLILIYLAPYMYATFVVYYQALKGEKMSVDEPKKEEQEDKLYYE
ncbi:MAG: DUF975 family protein [Bacilli bacterium]|nr:DUF975 family protein [Bacilli bacterium]